MAEFKGNKVRISMSAEVANELDAFKKGVIGFAEEIGCPKCFSGLDCTFESAREFVIDPAVKLRRAEPRHERATLGLGSRAITVPVSTQASYDLGEILERIDLVGNRLGSHWENGGQALCCSGFDITFEREARISVGPR